MEDIIENNPELIAEEGYKITDGDGLWNRIRLFDWSLRFNYYAVKDEPEPQPEIE